MFGPCQNTHHEHHNNIRNLVIGIRAPLYRNLSLKHFLKTKLLCKTAQMSQSGIAGQVLLGKSNMIFSHHNDVSFICSL